MPDRTQPDGARRVQDYLDAAPEPQRATLTALRATLHKVLPRATDTIKYGMPAVLIDGAGVAGYAAFKAHCGYFPFSSGVLEQAGDLVAPYATSKGGLQFPVDRPLPVGVVRRLVRLRLDELGSVTNGMRREYFDDGTLKAEGAMRAGELHGPWRWYRKDGTLLRTGSFRHGTKTGEWTTYDRSGEPLG
jgi:uncharacterized protein YdhG (YjbR/CyaY superfamily)